ncbi:hypothetical protein J437_LFUL008106 [Ladona fulva]|uniref:Uncharacterized protein n=1 Tax=Ladona fulva TaxID=123851 RepID=A0A8K0JZU6_LADFU|nr:hypothetical protein J437_LFUL008106 [Ladona fulva]
MFAISCPKFKSLTLEPVDIVDSKEDSVKRSKYDNHYPYHLYATAAPDPYHVYWYDTWANMSALSHWPASLFLKEAKDLLLPQSVPRNPLQPAAPSPIHRDSVAPSYLSHGPPVLLHPERVVPLSDSERFERTFQPNVALAPARRRGTSRRPTTSPPQTPGSLPPPDETVKACDSCINTYS